MYRFNSANYSSCKEEVQKFCKENNIDYETSPLSRALSEVYSSCEFFVQTLNGNKRDPNYFVIMNESRQRIEGALKNIKQFSNLNFKLKTFIEDIDESKEA